MSVDEILAKALGFLRARGLNVDLSSSGARRLVDLFRRGAGEKPPIKPYHVDPPSIAIYSYLEEAKPVVYAEQKFDGTHVQLSASGVFKHDGGLVAGDQLGGLLYFAALEPDKAECVLSMVEEGYVVEAELFGSMYTPMGFHKDYEKPFDLVVFEVGAGGRWIPPPEKYDVYEEFGAPHPESVGVVYEDALQLKEEVERLAGRPEWFEGAVVKAPFKPSAEGFAIREYVKTGSLIVFKVKKSIERRAKEKKERAKVGVTAVSDTYRALVSEAVDEVRKIAAELGEEYVMDVRNTAAVIERVVRYLGEAHPELVERFMAEGFTERDVRKVVGEAVMDVRRQAGKPGPV